MSVTKLKNDQFAYKKYWIPKKPNFDTTSDYFESKTLTKTLPRLYNTGDDITERNAVTNCEITKNILYETERKHARILEKARKKRAELNKQWEDLEKKELEFRENFQYFEKFVRENEMKRMRANGKLSDVAALLQKRSQDVDELQKLFDDSKSAKNEMDKAISDLRIFENFLVNVRDKYQHMFDTTTDILKRYSSLLEAKSCVGGNYEHSLKELEGCKKMSDRILRNYYIKIAGIRAEMNNLNQRYDLSKSQCQKWELFLDQVNLEALNKLKETIAVKDSCWKIYKDMCERKSLPTIFKDDYGKQFDFIKKILYQYKCINEMVRNMEEEKLKLSEKACVSTDMNITEPND